MLRKAVFFIIILLLITGYNIEGKKRRKKKSNLAIIGYENHLNKKFVKRYRKSTKFIIIHTSEAGKRSTLRTLSEGKRIRNYWTKGGHANYMIDRSGNIYRILKHIYRADHVGLSMWNGLTNLSNYSIGIELVGFHYGKISNKQYKSLSRLLKVLKRQYGIRDKNVLTHSQVSYGRPNRWFKRPHRGRKKCALNFERKKAGLKGKWKYDPDVRRGRLSEDPQIKRTFYSSYKNKHNRRLIPVFSGKIKRINKIININISNKISKDNTAWSIAGEDYDSVNTLYVLPSGKKIRGNNIGKRIGWGKLPRGTIVHLNYPLGQEKSMGPIFKITGDFTAWSFAGKDFNKTNTVYFLPNGKVMSGNRIHDWDALPEGTKMIVGFNGPFILNIKSRGRILKLINRKFKNKKVVLHLGRNILITKERLKFYKYIPQKASFYISK